MEKNTQEGKYVTQAAFDSFVKSISQKVSFVDSVATQNHVRLETFLKLLFARGEAPSVNNFVEGLVKYDPLIDTIRSLRNIVKVSDRIEAAFKYNEANPDAFQVMADDIGVLEQAQNVESISKSNYDSVLRLPHTNLFATLLSKHLPQAE